MSTPRVDFLKGTVLMFFLQAFLLVSDSEEEDEINLPRSKASSKSHIGTDDQLSKVKQDMDIVAKTMKNNMNKVLDRGSKLEDLQDKTDDLDMSAFKFVRGSRKLQRKMWWQNMKLKVLFGFILVSLLLVLIVSLVVTRKKK
ncbi:synaptobrevin homolog 2-like isoform X1 [Xenia sp. Carnegie-2017]|uniref:synaptobrevin homolog 2-like isoform X1 n=1 Tax=Xenia sp. Carnegie-2017 TaxID=2897299 RepID=UPI001F03809B|nr:synaptobrevin homolog 2-like isoform X1 [Xenia sp. Carnegie-2017]